MRRRTSCGILLEVHARDPRLARGGADERREHAQRRGLAGPVGAEEAEDLPAADLEVDASDGLDGRALRLVRLAQVGGPDHGSVERDGFAHRSSSLRAMLDGTCAVQQHRAISERCRYSLSQGRVVKWTVIPRSTRSSERSARSTSTARCSARRSPSAWVSPSPTSRRSSCWSTATRSPRDASPSC